MPLVWDLTATLKEWLTPQKLRSFNDSWRSQGGGLPDTVIADFVEVLSRSDLHYESILGHLETQFMRRSPVSPAYHYLYSWLVQMVYYILYSRHIHYSDNIRRNLKFYSGLTAFAEDNKPLWIFSLNHDLIVECLATTVDGLSLRSGFTNEVVYLPRRDPRGAVIGHLKGEVLRGSDLERSGLPFFQHGVRGINLLKIHGSLDTFTFRDGKDLLRILPVENSVDGVLDSLRITNKELHCLPQYPAMAMNEIAYADEMGEMQFLRRSLLAGSYKFDPRNTQVLPPRLLNHFRTCLNYLRSLVCIGYGFGDIHVNQVMREWLELSGDRRLLIIRPDDTCIPSMFLHVAPQIELRASNATDYLDSFAGLVRSRAESNEKRFSVWMQRRGDKSESKLRTFLRNHRRKQTAAIGDFLNSLPTRDGDLDTNTLGMSVDELILHQRERIADMYEAEFEEFLSSEGV